MNQACCPFCGQESFTTLCTDCQAEGIRIQQVKSVFHIGKCHRCGHVDDEPCPARVGSNKSLTRALQEGGKALRDFSSLAVKIASRAAGTITGGSVRHR